ncbi:tetratricopeptide repeat protein [Saccharicrinis sp. 156]|uniref:tetratricopeptide repeat protein n=1 Tax=Saccharicrinis sp. 156 TaxID=3417574 RepID=UPI003D33EDDC
MKSNKLQKYLLCKQIITLTFVLWMSSAQSIAQTKTYAQVDSTTYALYLNGNWHNLIQEGQQAIDSDIDYFYLRMRMAYAYFKVGKYRNAIPHYQKALGFNSRDANAQYFLMLCYEYSGRKNDALKFSAHIDEKLLPDMAKRYNNAIYAAGIVYSYSSTNESSIEDEIVSDNNLDNDGVQIATNYFHDINTFVSHRLGKSIIVHHGLEYLYKSDFRYLIWEGEEETNTDRLVKQWNYGIKLQVTPWDGGSFTPGINFVNVKLPNLETDDNSLESTLYSFRFDQDLSKFKLGTSLFSAELNSIKTTQIGGHLTWFPQSNLNLYYSLDAYWHQQKYGSIHEISFNHKHILGFKITKNWWAEASALFPEVINFYDFSIGALHNSLEGTKNTFGLTHIFLLNNSNLSFIAGANVNTGVSKFVPSDLPLTKSGSVNYNRITFSGGLIWKL